MNLMAEILIQVVIAFLAGSLLLGLHRKIMARVQKRPGPPIVQHLIHSLKFFFKETATYNKSARNAHSVWHCIEEHYGNSTRKHGHKIKNSCANRA